MKRPRRLVPLIVAVAAAAALLVGLTAAAANSGSASDPLISRSYLESVFTPQITAQTKTMLEEREAALAQKLNAQLAGSGSSGQGGQTYHVVTLSKGQTLTGGVGLEIMLRIGTAVCVADSAPGLIDMTSGGTINAGQSLVTNHLYMVTINSRGVQATSNTVKVLVRGSYTVS